MDAMLMQSFSISVNSLHCFCVFCQLVLTRCTVFVFFANNVALFLCFCQLVLTRYIVFVFLILQETEEPDGARAWSIEVEADLLVNWEKEEEF